MTTRTVLCYLRSGFHSPKDQLKKSEISVAL